MASPLQSTQPTRLATECQQLAAIQDHLFRQGNCQQQYLHDYIPSLTKAVLQGSNGLKGRCLVLNPIDHDGLPLAALCKQFDKLTLAAPFFKLTNHIHTCFPPPELRTLDFTGGNLPAFSRACESLSSPIRNLPTLLEDFPLSFPSTFGSYDFIVSHRVEYSLFKFLETYVHELLRRTDPYHRSITTPFIRDSITTLRNRFAVQHLHLLHQLVSPSGRILYCEPIQQIHTSFKQIKESSLLSSAEAEKTHYDLFNSVTASEWTYQTTPYSFIYDSENQIRRFTPASYEITTAYLLSKPT